ncbi:MULTISPECIES: hypothetical protein [unclassified Amycolatopsis]|uniref:hypothetical protein n=1 Tax=unclassified Amycolatopsis TaxID=2618356 RepID=UPI001EE7CAA4|nr:MULTISPECIES: hypothetical protein [unclassified Amycolatopsis]MCG3753020.1 hypothetical protein [Amycolatopsis sp. Poz14]
MELLVRKLIARPEPLGLPTFEDELTAMLTRCATGGLRAEQRTAPPGRLSLGGPVVKWWTSLRAS